MLPRIPTIVSLLLWRGPTHVVWRIIAIIIDAIQRHAWWPFAYIFHEQSSVAPAFANGNSAGTVPFECGIIRIRTAFDHVQPGGVQRMTAHAMRRHKSRGDLACQASAGFRFTRSQAQRRYDTFIAAIAAASKEKTWRFASALRFAATFTRKNSPAAEYIAGNNRSDTFAAACLRATSLQVLAANDPWRAATSALAKPPCAAWRWFAAHDGPKTKSLAGYVNQRRFTHSISIAQKYRGVAT